MIDDILKYNAQFVAEKKYEKYATTRLLSQVPICRWCSLISLQSRTR